VRIGAGILALAAVVAFWNSFGGVFVYDDGESITGNSTIRTLWPISVPLSPAFHDGRTVDGRPILNLTLALNYAMGGTATWGYHAVNLAIHILCGLTLFGILRRTLLRAAIPAVFRDAALPLACAITVLWAVHPLQSESVTYIIQRAESLSVLFYLLTLYGFIRGVESPGPRRWFALSVAACLLGMASKESVVTAPAMVFLYDRTFLAGTFREAWRRRWKLYLALMATWTLLAWGMFLTDSRGGTAGFHTIMSPWAYALIQCEAVVRYLRLSFWPADQIFDYGRYQVGDPWQVWPQALLLAGLGVATFYALWRRPVLGFALCSIFVVLAPTSSVVPIPNQTMAEHRMYLPLAGVIALTVAGIYFLLRQKSYPVFAALAVALTVVTIRRNEVYHSALGIWEDTVRKWPGSARAQNNLGKLMAAEGKVREVLPHYYAVARIEPNYPGIYTDIGHLEVQLHDMPEARDAFAKAVRQSPREAATHSNLANVLLQMGDREEAQKHLLEALEIDPENAIAHSGLGMVLVSEGKNGEALRHFEDAVKCDPRSAECRNNLGVTLIRLGRRKEALEQFREAVRLDPAYEQARKNLEKFGISSSARKPFGGMPP
jgi:Tfp pilus assembly protein PilF